MSVKPGPQRRQPARRPNPVVAAYPLPRSPRAARPWRLLRCAATLLVVLWVIWAMGTLAAQEEPESGERVQKSDTSTDGKKDSGEKNDENKKDGKKKDEEFNALLLINEFKADYTKTVFYDSGEGSAIFWGNVEGVYEWKGELVRVFADCIVAEGSYGEEDASAVSPGKKPRRRLKPLSFYAEGNVRLHAKEVTMGADAFYFDHVEQRGIALRASGRGRLPSLDHLRNIFSRENLTSSRRRRFVGGTTMGENFPSLDRERKRRDKAAESGEVARALPLGGDVRRTAMQMAFRAELLRAVDVHTFEGEDVVLSSCEYGVPHFGLHSGSMTTRRLESNEQDHDHAEKGESPKLDDSAEPGKAEPAAKSPEAKKPDDQVVQHLSIDPEDTWLEFNGLSLLPFPIGYWNTEWIEYNPIRHFGFTTSSKYGNRLDVEWKLNWILKQFPGTDDGHVGRFLKKSELGVITDYMSKRGFGHGVVGEYGRRPTRWEPQDVDVNSWDFWEYYGRNLYYGLDDHGRDRTAPLGTPTPDDDRDWATVLHRQRLPWVGTLDVEYSEQSDANFLREFFPDTQTEKEQESLFYLRRNLTDNVGLTALQKYRTNDYQTTRERVPEVKLFVMEQPVFGSGLYTDFNVQAANLRLRPGDGSPMAGRRYGRFDLVNEWAYPFGFGDYLRLRPFGAFRYSGYEEGLNPQVHSLERESFRGGVAATQEWSRIFRTDRRGWMRRWFGIHALKHSMSPQVTYSNLWDNDVDPSLLFPFDEVDLVDDREAVSFSVRNILWARGERLVEPGDGPKPRPGAPVLTSITRPTRAILDADLRLTWFPRSARDNMGDRVSLFDIDVSLAPTSYLVFRSRDFFDPNDDMDVALTDNSVTVIPVPDVLSLTVGERFREGISEFIYGRAGVQLTPKYYVEFFGGFDLDVKERTDIEVRLVRFMHRFALELSYSFDRGENDNHTLGFGVYPVELFEDFWNRSSYDDATSAARDYQSLR